MEALNPLSSSQIYPYIHQFLLDVGGCRQTGLSSEEVFTEVFHLCRRAVTDSTPGENLTSRYVEELSNRIGNSRHAELILCLSWVVLMVQEKPTYASRTFTRQLQPLIRYASIYNKAHQLAVTIRQHERHIQTDFFISADMLPIMKVQIECNPSSGPFSPAEEAAIKAAGKRAEDDGQTPAITARNRKPVVDTEPIRQEILTWVSKVRPLLCDAWKADYLKIWESVLNLQEVKEKIYNPGKQKKTNFNRYLVCNILYYMFEECGALGENEEYNASALSMALIGTTEHQIRKELAKNPPEEIKNRLFKFFTKKFQL